MNIRIFSRRNKIFKYSLFYKVKMNKLNGPIYVTVKHIFRLNKGKTSRTRYQTHKTQTAREPVRSGLVLFTQFGETPATVFVYGIHETVHPTGSVSHRTIP